jgi:hypothetical protein
VNSLRITLFAGVVLVSLNAPALAQTAIPDLGQNIWARPLGPHDPPPSGPGPVQNPPDNPYAFINNVGNYRADLTNPILQPWTAERLAAQSAKEAAGNEAGTAQQTCRPSGVPGIFQLNDVMQIVQGKDVVLFLFARQHQSRVIHLNAAHPDHLPPSWYGHSVGHYEGDTLVVDTMFLNDAPWADRYGTPQTEKMHVVERYRLVPDEENGGQKLELHFFVEDEGAFTMPWSAVTHYEARPDVAMIDEQICQENNRALGEALQPLIPRAEYTYPF